MARGIVGWPKTRLVEIGQAIRTITVLIVWLQPPADYLRKRSSSADFDRSIAAVSLAM